jgi:hypothetical protein
MADISLGGFITAHRDELIRRCTAKVALRAGPTRNAAEIDHGVPLFLTQIVDQLDDADPKTRDINHSATQHGRDLFFGGSTVSQVVHDYGDVCQSVTELAGELDAPFATEDFRTLNRCLDDAIAGAVTEFAHQERSLSTEQAATQLAELNNLVFTAISAMEALQSGNVGIGGSTGRLLARTLLTMRLLLSKIPKA